MFGPVVVACFWVSCSYSPCQAARQQTVVKPRCQAFRRIDQSLEGWEGSCTVVRLQAGSREKFWVFFLQRLRKVAGEKVQARF